MATDLGSAAVPPPADDDHRRGSGPPVVLYLDLACPHCAADWLAVRELPLSLCVRHFPIASKRPRAPALHAAVEAAAGMGGEPVFWSFWDSLMEDQGHHDDPHLWQRAARFGLDISRFDTERRGEVVAERVQRDFRSGIRGGVVGTPAGFIGSELIRGDLAMALAELASA
ncbi:MAG: DsbA family protein [Solirubrobacterales bacterium]